MSKWIKATVEKVFPLSQTILQVFLKPETFQDYQAGQYLQIRTKNYTNFFSIANAPLGSHVYELHIRHENQNPSSIELLQHIKEKGYLDIQLPYGHCHLDKFSKNLPLIFIAGGTGFAPIKAIVEQILFNQDERDFEVYWGAKNQSDLYMEQTLLEWQQHVPHFKHLQLTAGQASFQLLEHFLKRHQHHANKVQVILSGPFDMVFNYRDELIKHHFNREHLFSDAFEYEK